MIFSEKQQLQRQLFREFAQKEFTKELLDKLESTGEFDREIHNKMAKAGMHGIKIPQKYGGQGGDNMAYVLMLEEFAQVSPVLSIYANTANSLGSGPLLFAGSEEQRMKYLPEVASGKKIMVFCLSEPEAGSDAGGTATTATQVDDGFILNGRKTFVSGAPMADYAIVFARSDPKSKGSKGISMFIVDMTLPGVSCGADENKMGMIGYPTSDLILDNVHVAADALIGPLHKGFATAMKTLDGGRLGVAAQAMGIAQGALNESVSFAKDRRQFGKRIGDFQAINFMLADMATELQAAKELVYSAAQLKDANSPEASVRCSMAKLFAAETANKICARAVQIHGGYGYSREYAVERFYRDCRVTTIYEGTSQVQQLVIGGSLMK